MSVLTIMTMVAVLPAIAEIATIGKTLTSAFIASLYFMVIIWSYDSHNVMTVIFIMAVLAVMVKT